MSNDPTIRYSSRLVDPFTLEQKKKEDQMDAHTMSMKDRILKKWKKETGEDAWNPIDFLLNFQPTYCYLLLKILKNILNFFLIISM